MDKIAVIIPCYNEEQTIAAVVKDYRQALPEAVIYVIDNNSRDNTAAAAREAGAIVRRESAQGKGHVLRRAFREIDAEVYLTTDGDGAFSADSAPEFCRLVLEENYDMVIGDRHSANYAETEKRAFHGAGNRLVRWAINTAFRTNLPDIMSGLRAYSYTFVKTLPIVVAGFEIETEMTLHAVAMNLQMIYIRTPVTDRPAGSKSSMRTFYDGAKVLRLIFRLVKNYKPFAFFTALAGVLFFCAIVSFVPVFIDWYPDKYVSLVPTFILSMVFVMTATQSFFAGLILDNIRRTERREYELRRVQVWDTLQRQRRGGKE
ncbi:MAG: glycosyltransferase family 2 protein [Oscillospiraceae bacterium]|jgi:glycosyltransferase involved in cell wall biosynthesis|nr:glycosyltransferase family 2 protein [Oscillospiraceae bacterium]